MELYRVLILARESRAVQEMADGLTSRGFACTVITRADAIAASKPADILLLVPGNVISDVLLRQLIQHAKEEVQAPVILLADKETLRIVDNNNTVDDFILKPFNLDELSVRIKRLMQKNTPAKTLTDYLKAGDIVIDLPKCEVSVRGKVVDLTFTEYELLKLLMSKKGQVLTREVLLNKIWGYDYFGGDRTVDVHITRLRNKIEDTTHTIIETVRNIGYRIKPGDN